MSQPIQIPVLDGLKGPVVGQVLEVKQDFIKKEVWMTIKIEDKEMADKIRGCKGFEGLSISVDSPS